MESAVNEGGPPARRVSSDDQHESIERLPAAGSARARRASSDEQRESGDDPHESIERLPAARSRARHRCARVPARAPIEPGDARPTWDGVHRVSDSHVLAGRPVVQGTPGLSLAGAAA